MIDYVMGFLFNTARTRVVLLRKTHGPACLVGKYVGPGGKVEPGETPKAAMCREFAEETSAEIHSWELFGALNGNSDGRSFRVHLFRAFVDNPEDLVSTQTDERVLVCSVGMPLSCWQTNMFWMIPMALSMDKDRADFFEINEFYEATTKVMPYIPKRDDQSTEGRV